VEEARLSAPADIMQKLKLDLKPGAAPQILCLGAHCDDIEIGCSGALMELIDRYPRARITWVVLSSGAARAREARRAAAAVLRKALRPRVEIQDFRISFFPVQFAEIKAYFEELKQAVSPDLIFTHQREDLHQDHRTVAELTWNTFRSHMILEYEIPKYDGGLGSPSVFVPLRAATMRRKLAIIMRCFVSQHEKQWFTPETFSGLMRLRGIECNAADGYSEAFYARKVQLL
jgi:LmbE family N-acetylglucosaminyl deacetylase